MDYTKEFDQNQELYDAILTLESTQGWKMYREWLQKELEGTEKLILSIDDSNNEVKYTGYDLLRNDRAYIMAMLDFTQVKKNELKPVIESSSEI